MSAAVDARLGAPDSWEMSYNKVKWGALSRTKITSEPVPGPTGATTKYVKHTLSISGPITADAADAADGLLSTALRNSIADMRKKLREPAKVLTYKGRGYDLDVNRPGGAVWDSANGPHPRVLSFVTNGGNSAFVDFEVVTQFPECDAPRYSNAVAGYAVEITYSIDKAGYTTVRYSGEVEIASTTLNGRPQYTADSFRVDAEPSRILGYQRSYDSWELSADRRTLKFHITDTQLPAPLLTGAAEMDLRHTVKSTAQKGFFTWDANLSGSVVVPAGRPRGEAAGLFMQVLSQRLTLTREAFAERNRTTPLITIERGRLRVRPPSMVMITAFSATEDVFGRGGEFSCDYTLFGSSLEAILDDAGLWMPLEGADHRTWSRDQRRDGQSARGGSGLKHRVSDDGYLIDLCNNNPPRAAAGPPPPAVIDLPPGLGFPRTGRRPPREEDVPPELSWVAWHCSVSRRLSHRTAVHCPIGTQVRDTAIQFPVTGDDAAMARDRRRVAPETQVPQAQANVVQRVGNPVVLVTLSGFAVRVGHDVNPPRLLMVADQVATPGEHYFDQSSDARAGVLINTAQWVQEYYLPAEPRSLPRIANPVLRSDGRA